jgi:hypothetical protein
MSVVNEWMTEQVGWRGKEREESAQRRARSLVFNIEEPYLRLKRSLLSTLEVA